MVKAMLLNEYLKDFNLFAELAVKFPQLPITAPVAMDFMLVTGYGEREVFRSLLSAPKATVLEVIGAKYTDRWNSLVLRQAELANVSERRELKETINETVDSTNSRTDTNKVSAFNSPDLVDNTGSTATGEDGKTGETIRTLTDEKIDPKTAFGLLNVSVQDTIISTVVADVSSFLTLSIY